MIKIDAEFQDMIPPLTDDEFEALKESIREEGCRDAIVCWGNTIIDGHNRYEICSRYGIPFEVTKLNFANREEAKQWIIDNQLGRRNLSDVDRMILAQSKKKEFQERGREHQRQAGRARANSAIKEDTPKEPPVNTREEIAKIAGVSQGTLHRFEKIQENYADKPEELKGVIDDIRKGEKTVGGVFNEIKKPQSRNNNEWCTPRKYIALAREVMGRIDIDPATNETAQEYIQASEYYTEETNGLDKEWNGNVWLCPPFSINTLRSFVTKFIEELDKGHVEQAIVLVNNATDTVWFNKLAVEASAICFPMGRIKFDTPDGKVGNPTQGQCFMYFGDHPEKFASVFNIGQVMRLYE